MMTKVLYWWCGIVKNGYWVGYKNGNFLIYDSYYDKPVETKIIYPLKREYIGKFWNDIPELKQALDERFDMPTKR